MLKRTFTYVDYDGITRTEDFYFNITKAEAIEMELGVDGGLTELIKKMIAAKDSRRLVEFVKEFILKTYGIKSDDGRRFMKSKEISDSFVQSPVYSMLFTELSMDATAAAAFVNAVVPRDLELASTPLEMPAT